MKSLRPDQQRLVWLTYDGFARNGATLEGEAKERYAEINQRLAELHTKFANNVLADEEGYVLYLTEDQLGGLQDSFVQAAAAAATERDHDGEYAITNTRSSMDPCAMTRRSSTNRGRTRSLISSCVLARASGPSRCNPSSIHGRSGWHQTHNVSRDAAPDAGGDTKASRRVRSSKY